METKHKISLFVVSVVLGVMLTVQFSTVHRPKAEATQAVDNLQLTSELAQERERNKFYSSEIERLENQIRSYEEKQGNRDELAKAMHEELEKVKMLAGAKEYTGNGVIITIEDSFDAVAAGVRPTNLLMGEYLYQLVSSLYSNGAQAIAIENHRLMSMSSVRTISESNLQVNRIQINPSKVTIRAVGNVEQMKIGMNRFKDLFFTNMGKDFKSQDITNNSLKIPPYEKPVEFLYAKPEGDKAL